MQRLRLPLALAGLLLGGILAGCGGGETRSAGGRINVAAAENFWASIAAQLGGSRVNVTSIIANPNTDPHAYEPTPADGRTIAAAQYVIINGAGYDSWAPKLVDASPSSSRIVFTVAEMAGRKEGDNPHMWYDPAIVAQVVDHITGDYKKLDPADAAYFDSQAATFKHVKLKDYNALRATIRSRYSGVAVGSTESLFVDLAHNLGLNLITPAGYMKAVSEGEDPGAADKATFDAQLAGHKIRVLVFNSQNSTPDIQGLITMARSENIPVVPMTETLQPANVTFQGWQAAQLQALASALAQAEPR